MDESRSKTVLLEIAQGEETGAIADQVRRAVAADLALGHRNLEVLPDPYYGTDDADLMATIVVGQRWTSERVHYELNLTLLILAERDERGLPEYEARGFFIEVDEDAVAAVETGGDPPWSAVPSRPVDEIVNILVAAAHLGPGMPDGRIPIGPRRDSLSTEATQQVIAEFESARQYLADAIHDGWVPEENEEYVRSTLEEIALVRRRAEHGPVNPQQVELLIADLVRTLNGLIRNGPEIEREFIRLGADEATAAVAADRLIVALTNIEQLGVDDPVEDGRTAERVVEAANDVEGLLDDVGREMAKEAGREVTGSAVGFAVRKIVEHGPKIAIGLMIAVHRAANWLFGWG